MQKLHLKVWEFFSGFDSRCVSLQLVLRGFNPTEKSVLLPGCESC